MIHYCIDVYTRNEKQEWELWFTQSFKTKKLATIWANGFRHGSSPIHVDSEGKIKIGCERKLSEIYRRKREYNPNIM